MLILASGSPRRQELLGQAGLEFVVDAANVPELLEEGEDAATFALRLAEAKAQAVWARWQGRATADGEPLMVLGADTCVLCQGEVLGKPRDVADARRMLEMLGGADAPGDDGAVRADGERELCRCGGDAGADEPDGRGGAGAVSELERVGGQGGRIWRAGVCGAVDSAD